MTVSFKNQELVEELLARIESNRVDATNVGNLSKYLDYRGLLFGLTEFDKSVPDAEARRIVEDALVEAEKQQPLKKSTFHEAAKRLESEYLARPEERFVLLSSISINKNTDIPRFRIDNTLVILEPEPPSRFQRALPPLLEQVKYKIDRKLPEHYMSVRIHVTARGFHHAANKALQTLDFIRATWNFRLNYFGWRVSFDPRDRPLNQIVLGPAHTLHYRDGTLATEDNWWYQPEYSGPVSPLFQGQGFEELCEFLSKVRDVLNTHPYEEICNEGLIRYTQALDESRSEIAYRKLWSVLEFLTEPHQKTQSNKTTIKRAKYILKHGKFHKYVLNELADYRNELIHADRLNEEISTYLSQLKRYVEHLLWFHIVNKFRFPHIGEAIHFLSQPSAEEDLRRRIRLAENAIEMLEYD